jgi:hypothetical protein
MDDFQPFFQPAEADVLLLQAQGRADAVVAQVFVEAAFLGGEARDIGRARAVFPAPQRLVCEQGSRQRRKIISIWIKELISTFIEKEFLALKIFTKHE